MSFIRGNTSARTPGAALRALLALVLLFAAPAFAQGPDSGEIVGRVFDAASSAPLSGATVVLRPAAGEDEFGPTTALTDAEGVFTLRRVAAGLYAIDVSLAGHRDAHVTEIAVRSGEPRRIEIPLPPEVAASDGGSSSAPEELVVTGEKLEDLVNLRIEADQFLNVVGVEEFSKFAAGDVAEVLERVAGINVVEGQFAIIRGLEDRYSSTTLDGAAVPSPDPDSQSVQLDLFPSEVVGNLSVAKTFSPELPGNSAGGSIDVLTHSYGDDVTLSLKLGSGWAENAVDRFLGYRGRNNVDRLVDGLPPVGVVGGVKVFPDIDALRAQGFRFVGANPVGREDEKTGSFFDDVSGVLESEFSAALNGTKEIEDRAFRFKFVASREIDYGTTEGIRHVRQPRAPEYGPPTFEFIPDPPFLVLVPGAVIRSGDLSLGQITASEGRYDYTNSEKKQQDVGFASVGFDLDRDGHHRVDGSFLFTEVQEDAVQLQENGALPGFDYASYFAGQLSATVDPLALVGIGPGTQIRFREDTSRGLNEGALAVTTFNRSTSFDKHRSLWVAQINGDHRFEPLPLHFSWAWNKAETSQGESALGMVHFYEPCGYSSFAPCPSGSSPIAEGLATPGGADVLGPGKFVARDNLRLNANRIDETSDVWRIDLDYDFEFTPASKFLLAGGMWLERADREVGSAFLEQAQGVAGRPGTCNSTATTNLFCIGDDPLSLGEDVFNDLSFSNGTLSGLRQTASSASREIDSWHLRGKFELWEKLDLLGGVRNENIVIGSRNDPFVRDASTGALVDYQGGPLTFPSRYLFFDRIDNPFSRPGGTETPTATPPPADFVYNDQILGVPQTPGACRGDDGSFGAITCVDFFDEASLAPLFNGLIDERYWLPALGLTFRPLEGLTLRGAWSKTVARPSFREIGYYVSVDPGTDDLVVGNPNLTLSKVKSWDARAEYVWGGRGDLVALSWFKKKIGTPIEGLILRDPSALEAGTLFQTFFNNPGTGHLWGVEAEFRKSLDILGARGPEWLESFSIGGNATWIDASVKRTAAELARAERFFGTVAGEDALFERLEKKRRLFNQPEWIWNADVSFDDPDLGLKATLSYFAISDVLDSAGVATIGIDGTAESFTPDRYVGSYGDLRFTASKTFELPHSMGQLSLRGTVKNLTDSKRSIIYDPSQTNGTIEERAVRVGRDYSFSLTFSRKF